MGDVFGFLAGETEVGRRKGDGSVAEVVGSVADGLERKRKVREVVMEDVSLHVGMGLVGMGIQGGEREEDDEVWL